MAESCVTTVVAEVLNTGGAPNAPVTTAVAEVLHTGGVPSARVTGLAAEVLHGLEALTRAAPGVSPSWSWSRGERHSRRRASSGCSASLSDAAPHLAHSGLAGASAKR
jgi:hypothetical protein